VISILNKSSLTDGWIPITESKCYLVIPNFIANANPPITSSAPGPK
jgi:hypothetical protein